jgi:nucleotide-binding universal stress UspA family protein
MKRFSNILLVVDERADYLAALKRGVTLAANNQARLTVCTIVDTIPSELRMGVIAVTSRKVLDIAVARKRDWLESVVESVAADGMAPDTKVLVGKPFIEVIRQVLRNDHDLIIKCADNDGGLRDMLFSSTVMHLMRKCPCPVWVIKPTEHHKYRRILAAVDQDPEEPVKNSLNRQILEMSASLALTESSDVHVVHAWDVFGEELLRSHSWDFTEANFDAMVEEEATARRRWLEDLIMSYGNATDQDTVDVPDFHIHVIKGHAQHVVPELADNLEVDLVVMGTVARTGVAGLFMGNTAEDILAQLDCSVLTVKPPGFISPVRLES